MGTSDLWLIRHGETEWSLTGAHTGRTDIPLIPAGRERAQTLRSFLGEHHFSLVLSSPLSRALETCRIAGFGDVVQVEDDLQEWNYGAYEGKLTSEIRKDNPGWTIWSSGVPGGETLQEVAVRANRVLRRCETVDGDVALFAHGHILRILATQWLGLPPEAGKLLGFDTAAVSILGFEREQRVIRLWNRVPSE